MKRFFALALALVLAFSLAPVCYAEYDLSGLSFDELVALKDQINRAIWDSDQWQEVEVPQGVWEVGPDIPAGKWTILPKPYAATSIKIGNETKDGGTNVNMKISQTIKDKDFQLYSAESDISSWTVELEDGQYLKVDSGPAIFTPYAGKPSLGFKK